MPLTPGHFTVEQYRNRPSHRSRREGGLRLVGRSQKTSELEGPLVSIVTAVYNAERTIGKTIQSVLGQTYRNIEYIIIDGGSTDGTLDIIRKHDNDIAYWMSEPDEGISDAFNKGITASTGDIIGLLNADDWLSNDQIEHGVHALNCSASDFVFGDLVFHDPDGTVRYRINGDPDYMKIIDSRMPDLCHPTILAKRTAYERAGLFDTSYHFAMDYEWLLRLHRQGGRGEYAKGIVGHMQLYGQSDISYTEALREVRDIAVRYGQPRLKAHCLFFYRTLKGFVKRKLETLGPGSFYHRMRKVVNRNYESMT